MRHRRIRILGFALAMGAMAGVASAITIQVAPVADSANAADTTTYGAVSYAYSIGTKEVTNAQYCEFLNAVAKTSDSYGLFNSSMGITRGGAAGNWTYSVLSANTNKPVTYVSWGDAVRFANWLTNGGTVGSATETGMYTLNSNLMLVNRNASGSGYVIPTENEWYKAAFYDPTRTGTDKYWDYAVQRDAITTTHANYSYTASKDVGSYSYLSHYGAYDMSGNVAEWNEAIISGQRGTRGGHYFNSTVTVLGYSSRLSNAATNEAATLGFRVGYIAPEPATVGFFLGLTAAGILLRRRSGR